MSTLTLSDDTYHQLEQLAAARHLDVARLVAEMVERAGRSAATPAALTGDAWVRKFEEINRSVRAEAGRYPPGFTLDDSRETMYFGRGG